MTDHNVVERKEFDPAREKLIEREKEHTRKADELARERRELRWVAIEKDYEFDAEGGTMTLAELFDGRSHERPAAARSCPRPDRGVRLDGADRKASGLQAEDGLERSLGVFGEQRLQLRRGRVKPRRAGARAYAARGPAAADRRPQRGC